MVTASTPKTTKVAAAKKTVSVKATSLATETETKLPVVKKTAAPKPKVVKAAATTEAPATTVAAPAEVPVPATASAPAAAPLNGEQKARYVEVAAFYIAEQRGFSAGNPTDDWLAAEAEVDRLIATGMIPAEA